MPKKQPVTCRYRNSIMDKNLFTVTKFVTLIFFYCQCITHLKITRENAITNNTFNNISVISRQSVLSVEETRVPRENHSGHCPVASHWQTHNVILSKSCRERDSTSQHQWLIGSDCTGSCKSNYHMTTRSPRSLIIVINMVLHSHDQ